MRIDVVEASDGSVRLGMIVRLLILMALLTGAFMLPLTLLTCLMYLTAGLLTRLIMLVAFCRRLLSNRLVMGRRLRLRTLLSWYRWLWFIRWVRRC